LTEALAIADAAQARIDRSLPATPARGEPRPAGLDGPRPSAKLQAFLDQSAVATPYLVVDVDSIERKYLEIVGALDGIDVHYVLKANPHPEVARRLAARGAGFDAASLVEIDRCLEAGAPAERVSFGSTIKKQADIAAAHARGVRVFAFDAEAELAKLAAAAPGASVFCRLLIETGGAEWPLSRKFGCDIATACELLARAPRLGLKPCGVSFHVGSQQTDVEQWDVGVTAAAEVFQALAAEGIELDLINLGGGFPARYRAPVPPLANYAAAIRRSVQRRFGFGAGGLRLVAEVGRALVAEAGVIDAEVVLIARKSIADERPWVYLDVGVFNGLIETVGESIKYPILTARGGDSVMPVVLAGATCDSFDVMYDKAGYVLPKSLEVGDRVRILSAGAYTYTYSSIEFNGFPPLNVVCI
jgi:ornithine decarboxylase